MQLCMCIYTYKAIPLQAWRGQEGSRRLRLPDLLDNRHMKVVRLSALRTFVPHKISLALISLRGWVEPRTIVRPEGLSQYKIPMSPSIIQPTISELQRSDMCIYIYIRLYTETISQYLMNTRIPRRGRIAQSVCWLNYPDWTTQEVRFDSQWLQGVLFYTKICRPHMRPTKPPARCIQRKNLSAEDTST
jgi:hypothetical protein